MLPFKNATFKPKYMKEYHIKYFQYYLEQIVLITCHCIWEMVGIFYLKTNLQYSLLYDSYDTDKIIMLCFYLI